MQELTGWLPWIELYGVAGAWVLFALVFFSRKRPPRTGETIRDRRSIIGLLIQIVGFIIVRLGLRAPGVSFLPLGNPGAIGTALVAYVILMASIGLAWAAVRTLGKQWSLAARLVEGHDLITEGPYGYLRHPIYTAMLGMLVGTAIAIMVLLPLLSTSVLTIASQS